MPTDRRAQVAELLVRVAGGVPDAGPAPAASGVECITREWCPSYRGCCRRGEHLDRQPCAEVPACE